MWVIFAIVAVLFLANLGWWIRKRGDSIRTYRDHLEAADAEAELPHESER